MKIMKYLHVRVGIALLLVPPLVGQMEMQNGNWRPISVYIETD